MLPILLDLHGWTVSAETDLEECLDYYEHTKAAWRLVQQAVRRDGMKFEVRNAQTQTVVDQDAFVGGAQGYITDHLLPSVLGEVAMIGEEFVFEVMRLWFLRYPDTFSKRELDLGAVLQASSLQEVVATVVDRVINEYSYKQPRDWFQIIAERIGVPALDADLVAAFAEIKATRDVHVHNRGIANTTYLRKAASLARCRDGEYLEVPEPYFLQSAQVVARLIADLSDSVRRKVEGS